MSKEVMQMALNALEVSTDWDMNATGKQALSIQAIKALRTALAQPEPEPVAMKFQIYKQTPPRGRELEPINSALLPWVYDQDPSSGNIASMWVTPVATLPLQRKPLSDEQIEAISEASVTNCYFDTVTFARAIEAAHGIGGNHE